MYQCKNINNCFYESCSHHEPHQKTKEPHPQDYTCEDNFSCSFSSSNCQGCIPYSEQGTVEYKIRKFETGATRDQDINKFDIEGFLNPLVLNRFFQYMDKHRKMTNGEVRDSDNWQQLFGEKHKDVCIKSLLRHVFDLWLHHRGYNEKTKETIEDSICAIIFNANAYLLKILLDNRENNAL